MTQLIGNKKVLRFYHLPKISGLLMIFFHGHPESRKNAQADTKKLDFSMCISIFIKSAQSPLECGDF